MNDKKTVAQHAWDVYAELGWRDGYTEPPIVAWGDLGLLDEVATRATHTSLLNKHPLNRHNAILKALRGSRLFDPVPLKRPGGLRGGPPPWRGYRLRGWEPRPAPVS